jgi:small subunit ribosomal protein S20
VAKNRSAMKRAQLGEIRALANASRKSALKTAVKKFDESLAEGDHAKIDSTFKSAIKLIDKAASQGLIHPNLRDRKKAQIAKRLNVATASK